MSKLRWSKSSTARDTENMPGFVLGMFTLHAIIILHNPHIPHILHITHTILHAINRWYIDGCIGVTDVKDEKLMCGKKNQ